MIMLASSSLCFSFLLFVVYCVFGLLFLPDETRKKEERKEDRRGFWFHPVCFFSLWPPFLVVLAIRTVVSPTGSGFLKLKWMYYLSEYPGPIVYF